MPTPYPKEFRRDVIAVARQGGQSIAQVTRSFGISESCLARWLQIADREDARGPAGLPAPGGDLEAENRELRRRTKQLEQENEILRRVTAYFGGVAGPGLPVQASRSACRGARPGLRPDPHGLLGPPS